MFGVGNDDGGGVDEASLFREIMTQNDLLMQENRMLQSYYNRHMAELESDEEFQQQQHILQMQQQQQQQQRRRHNARGARGTPLDNDEESKKCTLGQLLHIAGQEESQTAQMLEEFEAKASKDVADLTAMLGETKVRINELKKETYEFRRDVVIGGLNERSHQIAAEKLVRWMEDKTAAKEALVEKIRLKNVALKAQISKLDSQLKVKEEQGESLHSIDFHQLKITNSQFLAKIKEKNAELLKLKMTTGKTVQGLNSAKRRLGDLMDESKQLQQDLSERENMLLRLTDELARVEADLASETKKNKRYHGRKTNAEMPQVMDYVRQKAELYELEQQVENWERKVEIAEMSAKTARRRRQ